MRYCIYGAGYRGRRLLAHIGVKRVAAFIDSDASRHGTLYEGVPVIGLDDYQSQYADCWIIVSPTTDREILELLQSREIHQYSMLLELPAEFQGYGFCSLAEGYSGLLRTYDAPCLLYGINAFSLMLYDALSGCGNDVFLSPRTCDEGKTSFPERAGYRVRRAAGTGDMVFLCCETQAAERARLHRHWVIDALGYTDDAPVYYRKRMLALKGSHAGERCFIVGTGPSLRVEDLATIARNGIFAFGVNDVLRLADMWHADAYVATDSFFMTQRMDEILRYPASVKILGDSMKGVDALPGAHGNVYPFHVIPGHGADVLPAFSEHLERSAYGGYTVTYACLQLAVYMGFKEIYLLGIDGSYRQGGTQNYFFESKSADDIEHRADKMMLAYRAARQYADTHGIKIYNATRGGFVEAFERVDFDGLFS